METGRQYYPFPMVATGENFIESILDFVNRNGTIMIEAICVAIVPASPPALPCPELLCEPPECHTTGESAE
jgi:hypothetical protein